MSPSQVVNTVSHINDKWLTTKEKAGLIKKRLHATEKRNDYLEKKIRDSFDAKSINVDEDLNTGLLLDHFEEIQHKYQPNSFHYLFWSEQLKNLQEHRHNGIQCLFIGVFIWKCYQVLPRVLLFTLGTTYDTLRKTLVLPCGHTLQDNAHFIKEGTGIQPEVTQQLLQAVKFDTFKDH